MYDSTGGELSCILEVHGKFPSLRVFHCRNIEDNACHWFNVAYQVKLVVHGSHVNVSSNITMICLERDCLSGFKYPPVGTAKFTGTHRVSFPVALDIVVPTCPICCCVQLGCGAETEKRQVFAWHNANGACNISCFSSAPDTN